MYCKHFMITLNTQLYTLYLKILIWLLWDKNYRNKTDFEYDYMFMINEAIEKVFIVLRLDLKKYERYLIGI